MTCVNSKCCKEAESGEKPDAKLGKDVSGEQGNQQNFRQRFWRAEGSSTQLVYSSGHFLNTRVEC